MNRRSQQRPESRQPEDEGRFRRNTSTTAPNTINNTPVSPHLPRTPRTSTSPASSPSYQFPKTRCYRLNLEKPFDISEQKSPNGYLNQRDYTGPVNESDMPPCQGPLEYYPPPHLCSRDELLRHSWGGNNNITSGASELMANLQVSCSEESSNATSEVSIAISTARIFRGITVDRNGVITSQNARAMRSRKGSEPKNKQGEKSRQAAKIDKAKDLIDDIVENGGVGGGGTGSDVSWLFDW